MIDPHHESVRRPEWIDRSHFVGAGKRCAVRNMRPSTSVSYGGDSVVELSIADPLPPARLAVAYDRTRPRRLVRRFVDACREHFAEEA